MGTYSTVGLLCFNTVLFAANVARYTHVHATHMHAYMYTYMHIRAVTLHCTTGDECVSAQQTAALRSLLLPNVPLSMTLHVLQSLLIQRSHI